MLVPVCAVCNSSLLPTWQVVSWQLCLRVALFLLFLVVFCLLFVP
jgi:hypothetical protein